MDALELVIQKTAKLRFSYALADCLGKRLDPYALLEHRGHNLPGALWHIGSTRWRMIGIHASA